MTPNAALLVPATASPAATIAEPVPVTRRSALRRAAMRHGGFMVGLSVLALIVFCAIAAPWLTPHDPYAQSLVDRLKDPVWYPDGSWTHPLGTDAMGRDYLARLLYGARISLTIGIVAMLVSGLIGTTLGVLAGYFGGPIDRIVTFMVTVRLSMPVVLIALAVVAAVGSSLTVVILVLGCLLWDRFAVVMRAATRQVREREYIDAARTLGCSTPFILLREALPNVMNPLIVVATLEVAHAILLEASLSFLGMGVQPPTPSWGLMISEARQLMFFKGWLVTIPGLALFCLVLAVNLLGDGLRDVTGSRGRN